MNKRGRPTKRDEAIRAIVIDESWKQVRDALDDKELSKEVRLDAALKIATKSMPTEFKGGLDLNINLDAMRRTALEKLRSLRS